VKLPCVPGCICTEVRLPVDNIFCMVIVVKNVLWLAQVVVSYFVLQRSKITLVLMTKVTYLNSLLFRQQDEVNSAVRRAYYLEITAKLFPTSVANWCICIPNFKIFRYFQSAWYTVYENFCIYLTFFSQGFILICTKLFVILPSLTAK